MKNKINIYDLGHIYFSTPDEIISYRNRKIDNKFSTHIILGIINFILRLLYSFFKCKMKFPSIPINYNGCLFYGPSRNTRISLQPIVNILNDNKCLFIFDSNLLPFWRLYLYAFPHIFKLLREYRYTTPFKRKRIKMFFPKFWRMYGLPKFVNELIDLYKPQLIIVANDHLEFERCLVQEAHKRGIKSMYIQHASVSEMFPSLNFSYSILDGVDAYEKYKKIGNIQGNIYLCGGIRFDPIKRINIYKNSTMHVGIAINPLDNHFKVKELCLYLKEELKKKSTKYNIVLRPHPSMDINLWEKWCYNQNILFSSPIKETSFEYLSKLCVLISNESSIHLDAANCNVPSALFNMSNNMFMDVYTYVEKGLIVELNTKKSIIEFILNHKNHIYNISAIRYFNYSYNTLIEGNVSLVIVELINEIIQVKENKRIGDSNFTLKYKNNNYSLFIPKK